MGREERNTEGEMKMGGEGLVLKKFDQDRDHVR